MMQESIQKKIHKTFSGRSFQPSLWPTLAYIVFMFILLSLGNWQVQRAQEKNVLFDAFSSGTEVAKPLAEALAQAHPRYQRVALDGYFIGSQQFLIDNIVKSGRVGMHVLTPLKIDSKQTLLVNRGWIPLSVKHGPASELQELLQVTSNRVNLTGRLDKMLRPGLLLKAEFPDTKYPKTVQFPTFEQISADLDTPIVAWQVLLDAEQSSMNAKGFVREWSPHEMGPERHIGYAVQWFALAFTLTIIFLVLTFRRTKDSAS